MHNFSQPSSGDWFKPAEHSGSLILITKVHETGIRFDNLAGKDKEYAIVDLVDLDETNPQLRQYVKDNHPGICNKLAKAARTGELVLGRITQVASDKGNPAWILGPFTPGQDDFRASAWMTANPLNSFGQPTNQAPAPAPQPVQQYAPQPQADPQGFGQYTPPQHYQHAPAPQPVQQQPQYAPAPPAPVQPVPQPQYAAPAPVQQYQQQPPSAPVQQYAPAPQAPAPVQQQPAAAPVPVLDPNNLPPEIAALMAQLGQQQPQQ